MKSFVELKTFEESPQTYDELEERLKKFFKEFLYFPLLAELNLPKKTIQNAPKKNPLTDALFKGHVTYTDGKFVGKFNASISKELRSLGAKFDKKTSSYKLPEAKVPTQVKQMISASDLNFQKTMGKLDDKLAKLIPEELADKFKCSDIFDRTLYKADTDFRKNIKNITVTPELKPEQRAKIAEDWQNNMKLYIKDWTEQQIKDLRKDIYENITAGARRESLIPPILKITETIQGSHDQAVNKAKFLAHQESRLMMAKFKEVRYTDAGIHEYIWRCVHRPFDTMPDHHTLGNVRYSHGLLNGKIFKFADPPVTTNPGEPARKNNPGTDFRCRCFARPILRRAQL